MLVNICCSASSGSTMLSHILNRHSEILCGEELRMFSKNIFYENFDHIKRYSYLISKYGISSRPYYEDRSILMNLEYYGLEKKLVWRLLRNSDSFSDFVKTLEKILLEKNNKNIWAEKTPVNIKTIRYFLDFFPDSKVVHIVRNPRDVILSLMRKGLSKEESADVWLSSVASIQPYRGDDNLHEIRYEDLILNPHQELESLCRFIGIVFTDDMINPISKAENRRDSYFDTWSSNPNSTISKNSLYKYKNSSEDFGEIYSMKITKNFSELQHCEELYLIDLMKAYNYETDGIEFQQYYNKKKKYLPIREGLSLKTKLKDLIIEKHASISRVEY